MNIVANAKRLKPNKSACYGNFFIIGHVDAYWKLISHDEDAFTFAINTSTELLLN